MEDDLCRASVEGVVSTQESPAVAPHVEDGQCPTQTEVMKEVVALASEVDSEHDAAVGSICEAPGAQTDAAHCTFVVLYKPGLNVRAHKARDAKVIGTRPFRTLVFGVQEGEWLSLTEGVYMLNLPEFLKPVDELMPPGFLNMVDEFMPG